MSIQDFTTRKRTEVERLFASCAYLYPLYTQKEAGWIDEGFFQNDEIAEFWTTLVDGLSPSMDDYEAAEVASRALLKSGISNIQSWIGEMPDGVMPQSVAGELARRQYLQSLAVENSKLAKAIGSGDDIEARKITQQMAESIPRGADSLPNAPRVHRRFAERVAAGENTIPTFIAPLDRALGGLEKKTEIIIAARPGMGKTTLGFQIAENVARGKKVIFYSLEMGTESLWARRACAAAGTTWRDLLADPDNVELKARVLAESKKLSKALSDNLNIVDTRQTSESIWRQVAIEKPDLIVIDHLRLVRDEVAHGGENKRQGRISENLKIMAKAYDIPVVVLVQLNRAVENRSDKVPVLSDLRDSGEIEENADVIGMLYRPEYYDKEGGYKRFSQSELWIRKFRNGKSNIMVRLTFDKERSWFEDPKHISPQDVNNDQNND